MYLMPEDGQYNGNMYHVLPRIIKFFVVDSIRLAFFNMVCLKEMNSAKPALSTRLEDHRRKNK
jgi:hypothetical protein